MTVNEVKLDEVSVTEVKKGPGRPKQPKVEVEQASVPSFLKHTAFSIIQNHVGQWFVVTLEFDDAEGVGRVVKMEPKTEKAIAMEDMKVAIARKLFV